MKTYRVYPKISAAPFPPGTAGQPAMLVEAANEYDAQVNAAMIHAQENKFLKVSEWSAVEERK